MHAQLTEINATVTSLIIPENSTAHRPPIHLRARTPGHGYLTIDGEVDVVASRPVFHLQAQLEDVLLVELNPLLTNFTQIAFAEGRFSGYADVIADGRQVGGYVKVLFKDLELDTFRDETGENRLGVFWQLVTKTAELILENEEEHQHAARLPLSGPLPEPNVDVWSTVGSALANAFINPIAPGFTKSPKYSW
jgi:hypothetical protein